MPALFENHLPHLKLTANTNAVVSVPILFFSSSRFQFSVLPPIAIGLRFVLVGFGSGWEKSVTLGNQRHCRPLHFVLIQLFSITLHFSISSPFFLPFLHLFLPPSPPPSPSYRIVSNSSTSFLFSFSFHVIIPSTTGRRLLGSFCWNCDIHAPSHSSFRHSFNSPIFGDSLLLFCPLFTTQCCNYRLIFCPFAGWSKTGQNNTNSIRFLFILSAILWFLCFNYDKH